MANIQHYDIGDYWPAESEFTVSGVATDPTTIAVIQQDPAGVETVVLAATATAGLNPSTTPVAKVGTGVYRLNPGIQLVTAGRWHVKFTGTGAAAAVGLHEAIADPNVFTGESGVELRALVTLAETKDWLQQKNLSYENDLELVRVINDVSDRFHQEADREFKVSGTNPQTRVFEVPAFGRRDAWYIDGEYQGDLNSQHRTVQIGDLAALTSVSVIASDWTTVVESPALGLVTTHPLVRQAWQPITSLELHSDVSALGAGMRLSVTGTWGFPAIPGDVRQAVLDAVAATVDREVEQYSQDLGFAGSPVVMIGSSNQRLLSMPPAALAVAWRYRASTISVG